MKLPTFLENLISKLGNGQERGRMTAKEKWLLFFLSGLLLAVIVFPAGNTGSDLLKNAQESENEAENYTSLMASGSEGMTLNQYEIYLSKKLEDILSEIDGAGEVQAWVTISGSSEKVLVQGNDSKETYLQEADSVGGTRTEETNSVNEAVIMDNSGNPYVVKTLQPEVEGVLVVAEGAGNSVIKKNISEAVEVLFGIEAHRIKVAKKKVEE